MSLPPLDSMVLLTALDAALQAGDYFHSRIGTEMEVKTKTSLADLVTDVDAKCEKIIRDIIQTAFPQHSILGEESTEPGASAASSAVLSHIEDEFLWIVDPLDGTTNFVSSIPLSVVSIAYAVRGEVQIGVIYDPYRGEVFYGVHGHGAKRATSTQVKDWLRDRTMDLPGIHMHASAITTLQHAVVATGFPVRGSESDRLASRGLAIANQVKSLRALGAAALHLAYVACGRIDAYWAHDLNAWDLAAGTFLVAEAGGLVCELGGSVYTLTVRNILAAGQAELAECLDSSLR